MKLHCADRIMEPLNDFQLALFVFIVLYPSPCQSATVEGSAMRYARETSWNRCGWPLCRVESKIDVLPCTLPS